MCRFLFKPIPTLLQHCWRVSVLSTALKQLPGKNNEEKMDRFIKSGMLNKELRDRFLRGKESEKLLQAKYLRYCYNSRRTRSNR